MAAAGGDSVLRWNLGDGLPTADELLGLQRVEIEWQASLQGLKDAAQVAFAAELAGVGYWVRVGAETPKPGHWPRWCFDNLLAGARIVWLG